MPMVLMLLLVLVVVAPPAADALTLQITSGSASVSEFTFFEPDVNVGGSGFTLHGFSGQSCCLNFGFGVTVVTMPFHASELVLNGVTFTSPGCCSNDSLFTFTNDPFPAPTPLDLLHYHGPYSTAFTMIGHIPLGGPGGVDFIGIGIMTISRLTTPEGASGIFLEYDFRPVPESPWLALVAFAVVVGMARRSSRHARPSAPPTT